jgi:hypothetical protein
MSPGKWNNYIKATGSGHCVIKVYSDSLPEIPKGYFFLHCKYTEVKNVSK